MRRLPLVLTLLAPLMMAGMPARAQIDSREGIALQNQILELRHELQMMQGQMASGGVPAARSAPAPAITGGGDLLPQLLQRVDNLEEEVRQLRGRIDELTNQQQVQSADLTKQIGDLNFQIQSMQGGRPGAPVAPPLAPPAANSGVPAPPLAAAAPASPATQVTMRRTPELAIQEGNAALARRDYATAEADARDVLNNYRTSPRAYDAQYLLAATLASKRDYAQAAIAYDDSFRRSPTGMHAQDSLLGLADSLAAINEKRAACDTLNQMRAQFPTPRADLVGPIASLRQRTACK
jgi:TolA-binding protein